MAGRSAMLSFRHLTKPDEHWALFASRPWLITCDIRRWFQYSKMPRQKCLYPLSAARTESIFLSFAELSVPWNPDHTPSHHRLWDITSLNRPTLGILIYAVSKSDFRRFSQITIKRTHRQKRSSSIQSGPTLVLLRSGEVGCLFY